MDPVSLAFSVASLGPLLQTALDCFQYVELGKSFGTNFQTCLLQLDNTQLRLSRWGQAVGIGAEPNGVLSLDQATISSEDKKRAEVLLGQIAVIFKDAERASRKLQAKGDGVNDSVPMEEALMSLHQHVREICLRRQGKTGRSTKAKWALHEREHFNHLISSAHKLVTDLVDLFPATTKRQRDLCDDEAVELRDEADLSALKEVAARFDKPLEEAIERLSRRGVGALTWK